MVAKKKTSPKKKSPTKTKAKAQAPRKKAAAKAAVKGAPKKKAAKAKAPARKAAAKAKAPARKAAAKAKAPARKAAAKAKARARKTAAATAHADNGDALSRSFVPYAPRKGEEYMNEAQRDHFRQILNDWKLQLMQEVDRTVSHMRDEATNYPDPSDRASQEEEFSLELKTRDRERRLIKKIDSTLEMISIDDYGYCESCGIEIGIRRLEARPTATQCIDCKTLDEIKERQTLG